MQYENRDKIWFPEPEIEDATYAKYDEHITGWLARSTVDKAVEYRRVLNNHLSKVPEKLSINFMNSSTDHWRNSVFELLVARFLQVLGAKIDIEKPNQIGKKPDFFASFTDRMIIVEATAPDFDSDIKEKLKQRDPLLAIIESHIPRGWDVGVRKIPQIGHSESKKEFKQAVIEIMTEVKLLSSVEPFSVKRVLSSGEIILNFNRSETDKGKIVWEPVFALWDESESRIRRAVKRKKHQVKGSKYPVVLAVHASGLISEWEDFDKSIFGHSVDLRDENLQHIGNCFREDGLLLRKKNEAPTYAGVLAFKNVDILYGGDPVFYKNPYFEETLPLSIEYLQQRCFDIESKRIFSKPACSQYIMEKIRNDALG